jgi:hypothetical protein
MISHRKVVWQPPIDPTAEFLKFLNVKTSIQTFKGVYLPSFVRLCVYSWLECDTLLHKISKLSKTERKLLQKPADLLEQVKIVQLTFSGPYLLQRKGTQLKLDSTPSYNGLDYIISVVDSI